MKLNALASHLGNISGLFTTGVTIAALVAMAGCANARARQAQTKPTDPPTTASIQANAPASLHGKQMNPPTPSPSREQTRTFDPFWIEAGATRERPTWSGNTAAVANAPAPVPATATFPTPGRGLWTPNTGAATIDDAMEGLTHVTYAPDGADFDPCVSRDSSFMVFASTQHRPTSDIYMKSVNGRTIKQLTADPAHDVMPSISPDGQRIAFCSNRNGNWDILVMSTTGGQAVQLTSENSHEVHPSWSPDGTKVVFCRLGEVSGRWELWVLEANGSGLSEFIGYGLFPQWCPVASAGEGGRDRILFQRSRERGDRAFSIWTVDYKPGDASSPTEIASSSTAALINACWSPDGKRIVFATVENPNSFQRDNAGSAVTSRQGASDLWITGIDGSGRINLTSSGQFMNLMPWWASDGRIYFVSDRTGVNNVWSVGTDKAIMAATGRPAPKNSEIVNAPEGNTASDH